MKELIGGYQDSMPTKHRSELVEDKRLLTILSSRVERYVEKMRQTDLLSPNPHNSMLNKLEGQVLQMSGLVSRIYMSLYQDRRVSTLHKMGSLTLEHKNKLSKSKSDEDSVDGTQNRGKERNQVTVRRANEMLSKMLIKIKGNEFNSKNVIIIRDPQLCKTITKIYNEYNVYILKWRIEHPGEFPATPLFVFLFKYLEINLGDLKRVEKKYERVVPAHSDHVLRVADLRGVDHRIVRPILPHWWLPQPPQLRDLHDRH